MNTPRLSLALSLAALLGVALALPTGAAAHGRDGGHFRSYERHAPAYGHRHHRHHKHHIKHHRRHHQQRPAYRVLEPAPRYEYREYSPLRLEIHYEAYL